MMRFLTAVLLAWAGAATAAELGYNRDVRPILSDNCFYCHGNDPSHRQAKLRLDVREDALEHRAFVPGRPEDSELVRRIYSDDPKKRMPPEDSHKNLSAEQKETLKQWIAQGAKYEPHWSYAAPVKPDVPKGANGVDFLVAARLKEVGLKPAAEADRRTLARRIYSDLSGLPPAPGDVAAFVDDKSPDAYEKLVDRLMASPHFGERMAIGWLDIVRFADTIGYHSDNPRNVFPYRDWVIRSFNTNKRFDRFTLEQVAGDLLQDADLESRVGSAFNRLLLSTQEGGAQAKDYEQRMLTDRVRAVGAVWLGQTTGCAQCHDHKFDPFTQRDFYSLGAFFADIKEPLVGKLEAGMPVPDEEQQKELARLDGEIAKAQQDYDAPHPEFAGALAAWEAEGKAALLAEKRWTLLRPAKLDSKGGAKLKLEADGSILARGKAANQDTYTLTSAGPLQNVTGLRLEALPHDSLPQKGPGRAGNGNFVVSEVVATVHRAGGSVETQRFESAVASFEQTTAAEKNPYKVWSAAAAIDGDAKGKTFGWAVLPETGKPQQMVLKFAQPLDVKAGEKLTVEILQNHDAKGHLLGRFRLATTTDAGAATRTAPPAPAAEIATILDVVPDERTTAQKEALLAEFKATSAAFVEIRGVLAQARKAKAALEEKIPTCLVSISTPEKRTVRILPRGNWMDESGEVVKPALPHYLPQEQTGTNELTRLDLARWLVWRGNPLTARTVMNRMWQQFFGTGLSKVAFDLGAQGELPPNQPLLDWLACEFVDSGWDMKHMIRTIVTSETYRRTSVGTPEQMAADPYNRELARQSAFRVEAELVRDGALAVSGLLVPKIGGPSVKPYQPEGYWENLNFPKRTYTADTGEAQYRRGLYVWWQRSYLHPSMVAFDAPTREECSAERSRSNIPQQALVLLNDPTYVEAARSLAARILGECSGTPEQRIAWAWRQVLQRDPRGGETQAMSELLARHLGIYRADPAAAEDLLKTGFAGVPADLDRAELAAWTHIARVLLNLHETITRS